jgi:hypothetical protein
MVSVAIVVVIGFSLYTFGSYSASPKAGTKVQPIRESRGHGITKQQQKTSNSILVPSSTTAMSSYENRDKPENYYSIQFPRNAVVEHGNNPGGYITKLPEGNAVFSVELVDIPDTSNVQLYMLSQDEPSLKSSLQHYNRVSTNQFTIGGSRAWDLTYTWKNTTMPMESKKTFVEGSDNAAVITFSGSIQGIGKNNDDSLINLVVQSFHWLGK